MGSKMEPKLLKNLIKFRLDFCNVFECPFFRSWIDFGSKNLSKMRVLGSLFQPPCGYARSVILNNPLMVLRYFSILGRSIFDFKRYIFQMLFQRCFQDLLFFDFGSKLWPNSMPNGSPNRLNNQWKSKVIFWWNFVGFSVAQGGSSPREQTQPNSMTPPQRNITRWSPELHLEAQPGTS